MLDAKRSRLILHGGIILLIALACGLPSVVEVSDGVTRMWQAAHSALLLMAVWMFAQAAILPLLVLKEVEASVLTWSLTAAGYGLSFAAIVQAMTGVRALGPSTSVVSMSVFCANLIVVLGSFLSASLTVMGAKNAKSRSRPSERVISESGTTVEPAV